jgi:DNA polymerase-4
LEKPGGISIGLREALMKGRCAPIAFASLWVPRTRFSADLMSFEAARDALLPLIDKVWRHCESSGTRGRTVTLKIKFADFQQITRSQSPRGGVAGRVALQGIAAELLRAQFPVAKGIRLLGVSLSAFDRAGEAEREQLPLSL